MRVSLAPGATVWLLHVMPPSQIPDANAVLSKNPARNEGGSLGIVLGFGDGLGTKKPGRKGRP